MTHSEWWQFMLLGAACGVLADSLWKTVLAALLLCAALS